MSAIELPALYVDLVAVIAATPRLVLVNRDPSPGETGVPIDAALALELVDTGPDGVDRATARVWVDDVLAFEGGALTEIAPAYAGPLASVTQTSDTLRIVLHPQVLLTSLATVKVRVLAQTVGGVGFVDEVYSFVIEDRTAPRVVGAQALCPKTVRVAFDKPVLVPSGASFLLTPQSAPAVPLAVVGVNIEENVVLLTLDTEMTPDVLHEVVAVGVTDLFGNTILGPFDRSKFTAFRPARPANRRFDLWQMMPKHNRRDDHTGDLLRFIACLQEVTDLLLADIDR